MPRWTNVAFLPPPRSSVPLGPPGKPSSSRAAGLLSFAYSEELSGSFLLSPWNSGFQILTPSPSRSSLPLQWSSPNYYINFLTAVWIGRWGLMDVCSVFSSKLQIKLTEKPTPNWKYLSWCCLAYVQDTLYIFQGCKDRTVLFPKGVQNSTEKKQIQK